MSEIVLVLGLLALSATPSVRAAAQRRVGNYSRQRNLLYLAPTTVMDPVAGVACR